MSDDSIRITLPPLAGDMYHFIDGKYVKMTTEERLAQHAQDLIAEDLRIAAGGCAHDGDWTHEIFESSRGGEQDAYYCASCGELMQVG